MKQCARCRTTKTDSMFFRCSAAPTGLQPWCKSCQLSYTKVCRRKDPNKYRQNWKAYARTPKGLATYLRTAARKRAVSAGVRFDLTSQFIAAEIEKGCAITGREFDMSDAKGAQRPFGASIDRINAGGDYTEDNCRVVLYVLNTAMNKWGLGPVLELAELLKDRR